MAGEACVFLRQGHRPDAVLDAVAVYLDATVVEESVKAVPVVGDIGELLAEAGPFRDAAALVPEPQDEGFDQGSGASAALGETPFGRASAKVQRRRPFTPPITSTGLRNSSVRSMEKLPYVLPNVAESQIPRPSGRWLCRIPYRPPSPAARDWAKLEVRVGAAIASPDDRTNTRRCANPASLGAPWRRCADSVR